MTERQSDQPSADKPSVLTRKHRSGVTWLDYAVEFAEETVANGPSGYISAETAEAVAQVLLALVAERPTARSAGTELRTLAERCRPAVAHDAKLRDMDTRKEIYAHSYRPVLEAAAERAQKLLDDLDAIIAGTPRSASTPLVRAMQMCQRHEGMPFTTFATVATVSATYCPHCEAEEKATMAPADSRVTPK